MFSYNRNYTTARVPICQEEGGCMKSVLIIGSLNMDVSVEASRIPVSGETVVGKSISYTPGGKGANQAAAAGKLAGDGSVGMIGCVGDDAFGGRLVDSLAGANVSTEGIQVCADCSTGSAVVMVEDTGANRIIVAPGSNSCCDVAYIQSMDAMLQAADYVMFQMEIPIDAVYYGIRRTKELGKTVILNPAPAPGPIPTDILQLVDYLTPNETELMQICDCGGEKLEYYIQAAKSLVSCGVRNVVVTLGGQGALVVNRELAELVPAVATEVVDTTAAGDCFNAAMVVALAEGHSLLQAVQFANAAAAISVSRKGAQCSLPTRQEVFRPA